VKSVAATAEVNRLTEKAYDLKQVGNNEGALALLEEAEGVLERAANLESEVFASNLDDRATIHLRMGHSEKARALYTEAETILQKLNQKETRLFAGIARRLDTMQALDSLGIVCDEPPVYKETTVESTARNIGTTDAAVLPYFPKDEDLQRAFGAFNLEMTGCVESSTGALPIWTVITGDGRIALSSVKSDSIDQGQKQCLEKKLFEISAKNRNLMPRFRACFRNFTYPLAFRK
jgi:tetratricopeptide (TPR) repeat protein